MKMNNILLMLKEQYARLEQAKKDYTISVFDCNNKRAIKHHKIAMACSMRIRELTLLLNAEAETNGQEDIKNDGNAV